MSYISIIKILPGILRGENIFSKGVLTIEFANGHFSYMSINSKYTNFIDQP